MKICSKCKLNKDNSSFSKGKRLKDGLQTFCKDCYSEYHKKYSKIDKNIKHRRIWEKEYRQREKVKIKRSEYHKIYIKSWHKNKLLTDPEYKLKYILRKRLNMALKRNQKSGSAVRDLGCTILELKLYLEKQFKDGMNWGNYGKNFGCWNIDHIIPLVRFNLSNRDQFLKAVHFTNLQPMWSIDNMSKNKY